MDWKLLFLTEKRIKKNLRFYPNSNGAILFSNQTTINLNPTNKTTSTFVTKTSGKISVGYEASASNNNGVQTATISVWKNNTVIHSATVSPKNDDLKYYWDVVVAKGDEIYITIENLYPASSPSQFTINVCIRANVIDSSLFKIE